MWKVLGFNGRPYYTGCSEKIAREYMAALAERGERAFLIEPQNIVRAKDEMPWDEIVRFNGGLTIRF